MNLRELKRFSTKAFSTCSAFALSVMMTPSFALATPSMNAQADDTSYTVEAYADATNGNVTKTAGNVTPTKKINGDAYGVYARAEDDKTATVTVEDISVNLSSADFVYGVAAYAGYEYSNKSSGHTSVTTGNVTSYEYGIRAHATYAGDTTVVVNGSVQAGAFGGHYGSGVYAGARDGARTSVTVNGNVSAQSKPQNESIGVEIDSPEYENQRTATTSITVNGDVTSSNGAGIRFIGASVTQDIVVTGTVTGSTYGVKTDAYGYPVTGSNNFTVWKVTTESGKADDMFVKTESSYSSYVADDASARAANYIVRSSKAVTPLAADGSALATSHDYPVAKEGEKVLITATNGNVVTKAYNNGVEITTKDENGNFYLEVPRGGGIDLSAEIGDTPAPKMATVPSGKTLVYNGEPQTGVDAGVGYTLSGTVSATEVGSYKATATLQSGYTWKDGSTGAKEIGWSITAAPTPVESQSMHRLYNPNSGEHFYTADDAERDGLVALGWNSEGDGWTAPVSSATPVYRMYNPVAGEHHYTPDASERDMLIGVGWNDEGIGWYSDDEQRVPLYRDYNPNAFANNHNYTVDESEHEWLLSLGWRDEDIAWYGM